MKEGVHAISHHQSLHFPEARRKYRKTEDGLFATTFVSRQIARLPFYFGPSGVDQ